MRHFPLFNPINFVFNSNHFDQIEFDKLAYGTNELFASYQKLDYDRKKNRMLQYAERVFIDNNGFVYYTNIPPNETIRLFHKLDPISMLSNGNFQMVLIGDYFVEVFPDKFFTRNEAQKISKHNKNIAFYKP